MIEEHKTTRARENIQTSDWRNTKWGNVATLEYGKALRNYENGKGKYPVYGTNGLIGLHDEPLCNNNGVIIGRKGAYRGVHYSKIPFFVIDTAFYLKPKTKELDLQFAYYELLTHDINSMDSGSAIPSTSRPEFYNMDLLLPPIEEQKRIASVLSSLDDKIEINLKMNKDLEEFGEAVFKRWFVDFEFPNQEGKPYRSTGGKMQYNKDFQKEIPQGWQVGCIGDVAEVIGGGTPSTKVSSYFTTDGIPWLTPKDLSGFEEKFIAKGATNLTPEGLKNSSAKVMPKGTILFTSRAPIGYIAIALNDLATNQGFKSLVPKGSMKSEYLYQYVKRITPYIQSISSGSTFGEVTGSTMKQIKILIPKLDLLQKFESFMEPINLRIINNSSNSQTLREIRDLLLPKLMSGKIRVPINKENVEMAVT